MAVTYMLAVVVDDHDMGITHVIRGDDHLNNAFRQLMVYHGMGWQTPVLLISPSSWQRWRKIIKRHGALGVDAYRDMGFCQMRWLIICYGLAGATGYGIFQPRTGH